MGSTATNGMSVSSPGRHGHQSSLDLPGLCDRPTGWHAWCCKPPDYPSYRFALSESRPALPSRLYSSCLHGYPARFGRLMCAPAALQGGRAAVCAAIFRVCFAAATPFPWTDACALLVRYRAAAVRLVLLRLRAHPQLPPGMRLFSPNLPEFPEIQGCLLCWKPAAWARFP